jgi:hypothetical protein
MKTNHCGNLPRKEARQIGEILLHYADGGEVEFLLVKGGGWQSSGNNLLSFDFVLYKYRIRQKESTEDAWNSLMSGSVEFAGREVVDKNGCCFQLLTAAAKKELVARDRNGEMFIVHIKDIELL